MWPQKFAVPKTLVTLRNLSFRWRTLKRKVVETFWCKAEKIVGSYATIKTALMQIQHIIDKFACIYKQFLLFHASKYKGAQTPGLYSKS